MKKSSELSSELPQALRVKPKQNYEAPQMKVIILTSSTRAKPQPFLGELGGTYGPPS